MPNSDVFEAIALRRREATARLSELNRTGEFTPPCDYWCSGIIDYDYGGERIVGVCPLVGSEPPCLIPCRERDDASREMRHSGFPRLYLEEATWDRCQARTVLWDWIRDRPKAGLLIHGPVGTGKTMAAVLAARELWVAGEFSRFVHWGDLLAGLDSRVSRGEMLRRVTVGELLVLDDFGTGVIPDWLLGIVDHVFEARNGNRGATIVTTNLTPATLRAAPEWARFVDRWGETMTGLVMPGPSMRRQQ